MKRLAYLIAVIFTVIACNRSSKDNLQDIATSTIAVSKMTADSTYIIQTRYDVCSNPNNDTILEFELRESGDTIYVESSMFTISSDEFGDYDVVNFVADYESSSKSNNTVEYGIKEGNEYFWIPFEDPLSYSRLIPVDEPDKVVIECWCTGVGSCEIVNQQTTGSGGGTTQVTMCVTDGCNQCCYFNHFSIIGSDNDTMLTPGVFVEADFMNFEGNVYN